MKQKFFNKDFFKYYALFGQIGLVMALNIIFSILIYKCFAKYIFENNFVFMLFIFIGIFNGFYQVYKLIMK